VKYIPLHTGFLYDNITVMYKRTIHTAFLFLTSGLNQTDPSKAKQNKNAALATMRRLFSQKPTFSLGDMALQGGNKLSAGGVVTMLTEVDALPGA